MAITKTINLEVNAKGAKKGIDDVTNSTKKLDKANSNASKSNNTLSASTAKTGAAMGGVATASTTAAGGLTAVGGAVGTAAVGFEGLKLKLQSVIVSLKSVKVAMMATGIGLVIVLLASLKAAFTRSEDGQNKFAKMMGVIGSITGNLLDLLADLGESIISVFENPQQAIKDFANLIKENITNRFDGLLNLIPQIGKAIGLLFEGEFTEAGKVAADAVGKVVLGVDSITDSISGAIESVKEFGEEVASDAKAAAKIADQRAKAEKATRKLIVERAQAEQDIARLREKAVNKEKFTAKERIEFLEEAGKISEDLAAKETEVAKLRLEAKLTENSLTKSNKEDLNEAAQLEASVIQLETQRLNLQKRLSTELLTARREATAQAKKDAKEEPVVVDKKLQKIYDIQKAFIKKQQDLEAETEIQKIQLEKERKLKELEDLNAHFIAKAQVAAFYENKIQAVKNKNADEDEKLAKLRTQQTLGDARNTFNQIAQLAGEDSKVGKAMAIASATISGVQGVMNAYTTAQKSPITVGFPAYPVVQASLAGLVAAKNIAAIKSVNPSGGGGGSIPTQSGGGGSTPPAFNVVGQSGESQLADAIGGQTQRPARAYVVSNDVTTAQELDRNIIEGASI
jgi:hypothetical protein